MVAITQHCNSGMGNFARFACLPAELQLKVWRYAVEDAFGPQACTVRVTALRVGKGAKSKLDFVRRLHYEESEVARACQVSRTTALALAESRNTHFRPDMDYLYIQSRQFNPFFCGTLLDNWAQSHDVRHLAIDAKPFVEELADFGDDYHWGVVAGCLGYFSGLQTLSLCFDHKIGEAQRHIIDRATAASRPPKFRIRDFQGPEDDYFVARAEWGYTRIPRRVSHAELVEDLIERLPDVGPEEMDDADRIVLEELPFRIVPKIVELA